MGESVNFGSPSPIYMHIDTLFDQLKANVLQALSQMPKDELGNIILTSREFGVTMLACAFRFATTMGVTRDQIQYTVDRCMGVPEVVG